MELKKFYELKTNIYRQEVQELLANKQVLGLDELYLEPRFMFGN